MDNIESIETRFNVAMKYRICAWARVTSSYNGILSLFGSKWYGINGKLLKSTLETALSGMDAKPFAQKNRDKWIHECNDIVLSESAHSFFLYMGYPALHSQGKFEVTGVTVVAITPYTDMSKEYRWKLLPIVPNKNVLYIPSFAADSEHEKSESFKVSSPVFATTCCTSTDPLPVMIEEATSTWISIEGTHNLTRNVVNNDETVSKHLLSLRCFRAILTLNTYTPKCVSVGVTRRTGIFLQRPPEDVGGSCDDNICPSNVAACRKDPHGGVLCFGCKISTGSTYKCDENGISVLVTRIIEVRRNRESKSLVKYWNFCASVLCQIFSKLEFMSFVDTQLSFLISTR